MSQSKPKSTAKKQTASISRDTNRFAFEAWLPARNHEMPPALTATQYPTQAPTNYVVEPSSNDDDNAVWLTMWLLTMVVFVVLPFWTSKRRRQLCMQGIRERRWISDDEYDFDEEVSGQREPRPQQSEATRHHIQTTRTQEDEIRQQYLSFMMENYTMVSNRPSFIVSFGLFLLWFGFWWAD